MCGASVLSGVCCLLPRATPPPLPHRSSSIIPSTHHEGAHAYHGAPNKNIGAAFLIVWKICDGQLPGLRDLRDKETPLKTPEALAKRARDREGLHRASCARGEVEVEVGPQEMCESAVTSFLKVTPRRLNRAPLRNGVALWAVVNDLVHTARSPARPRAVASGRRCVCLRAPSRPRAVAGR